MRPTRLAVVMACAFTATGLAQPAVPEVRLGQPELEYSAGFTGLWSVAELPGDELIVVGRDPAAPTRINLRTGGALQVGRRGQGPGEWSSIARVLSTGGDTAFLFDSGRSMLMTVVGRGGPRDVGRVRGAVEQVDDRGRVYYVGWVGAISALSSRSIRTDAALSDVDKAAAVAVAALAGRRDSMAVVRQDLRNGAIDTLAYRRYVQGVATAEVIRSDGRVVRGFDGPQGVIQRTEPVPPRDIVAFGRDGRVAIVRQPEYRVDWFFPDGRRVSGPSVPYAPVRLNAADIDVFAHPCEQPGNFCFVAPPRPTPEKLPTTWPPARSAQIAYNGELWVEHERNMDDSVPVFDVIDARGMLQRRVRLPDHSRLIGFGNGTVYVVRIDQDDLEYLQRYRLP